MSGYDYGNTRLRAMKSRLLSKEILESLARAENLETFITSLTKTPYTKSVEAALTRVSGVAVIAEAIRQDLVMTMGTIHSYYEGIAALSVSQLLRIYDVQNLKAVLRGLSRQLSPDEIMVAILPVSEIPESIWRLLSQAEEPRAAIDLLTTLRLPFAQTLMDLRAREAGASIAEMELALERWYFIQAQEYITSTPGVSFILPAFINLEADLKNILTVIRFAYLPSERVRLVHDGLTRYLVGPGEVSFQILESAGKQNSIETAVQVLANTPYVKAIWAGYKSFAVSGRLSDIELHLRRYQRNWSRDQMRLDSLGIGVPIGYLALKTNEINNLRWIAHAILQGLDHRTVQAGLEL